MAIKVKHEGNLTAAAFASAQGGKGRRAVQDTQTVGALMQQAATGGNQQLRGASAPGAAPGRSNAPITHAPVTSAPHAPVVPYGFTRGGVGVAQDPKGGIGGQSRKVSAASGGSGGGGSSQDGQPQDEWVIDSTQAFGPHSPDAVWNPWKGVWERKLRPGEREAQAYEAKLTAQQRAELRGINNALEDARRSGRYTEEELNELYRQADARRLGIKPLPQPKQETAQENIDQRRVTVNGVEGYLDKNGNFVQIEGAPKSAADAYSNTHVDEQGRRWAVDGSGKLYQVGADQKDDFAAVMKMVPDTKTVMKKDPATGKMIEEEVPLTFEEKKAKLQEITQLKEAYNKPQGSESPAPSGSEGVEGVDPAILMRNPMIDGSRTLQELSKPDPEAPAGTPAPQQPAPAAPQAEAPAASEQPAAPAEQPAAPQSDGGGGGDAMADYEQYKRK